MSRFAQGMGAAACLAISAAAGEAPLSVCFAENDPPRSARADAQGFDVDVARRIAARLGKVLRIVWVPETPQTDIESTDVDYRPILGGQCALQLSVPGAEAIAHLDGRLALSDPYYGVAYELLPSSSAFRWGEAYAGTMAVRGNTVAHVALDALGVAWTMQENTAGIVAALRAGTATSALVWGADLGGVDMERRQDFQPPAVLRWNLHAVARRGDPVLATVDGAIADDAVLRDIRALQRRYGMPPRAPFASAFTAAELKALRAR